MFKKVTYLILLLLTLTSCIEIIDDISLNSDGSGKFAYSINLSQSKIDINSYLALDYYDGKKVPSKSELKQRCFDFRDSMEKQPGISNCNLTIDDENFIIKFNCNFNSVENLQMAIFTVIESVSKKTVSRSYWITQSGDTITKKIPDFVSGYKNYNQLEQSKLSSGVYNSIIRSDKQIKSFTNQNSTLSKNGSAVLTRVNTFLLSQQPYLVNNSIVLIK